MVHLERHGAYHDKQRCLNEWNRSSDVYSGYSKPWRWWYGELGFELATKTILNKKTTMDRLKGRLR